MRTSSRARRSGRARAAAVAEPSTRGRERPAAPQKTWTREGADLLAPLHAGARAQRVLTLQRALGNTRVGQIVQRTASVPHNEAPLPESVQGALDSSVGRALEDGPATDVALAVGADAESVRIHDGAKSSRAARDISARAFTVGQDIHFGAGEYQPATHSGQRLLAHELTHTVQQSGASARMVQRSWYDFIGDAADAAWGGAKWVGGKVESGAKAGWRGAKAVGGVVVNEVERIGGAAWDCAKSVGGSLLAPISLTLPGLKLPNSQFLGAAPSMGGSPVGILDSIVDALRHPCIRMVPGYSLLLAGVDKAQGVHGFLKGAWDLLQNPEPILAAIREALSPAMSAIPDTARSLAQKAITFSDPPEGHLMGIWRHLEPKLEYLGASWWDILKETAWDLLWPWPGVGTDLGKVWDHIKGAAGAVWDLDLSGALDHILAVWRLANNIAGRLYGWFFLASVIVGAIVGAFFGGAGAIPGAAAGAKVAIAAGQYLLISTVAAEGLTIAKAGVDLAMGRQTPEENEDDYEQIANSGIVLAITGAMFMVGALAVRFARGVINRVAGRVWRLPALRGRGPRARGDVIEIRVAAAARVTGLLRRHAVTWLESMRRDFPVIDLAEGAQINVTPRPGRAPLYNVTGGRIISVKSSIQVGTDVQSAIRGWVDELSTFSTVRNVSVTSPANRTLMVALQTPLDDAAAAAARAYAQSQGVTLQMFTNLPANHPALVFPDVIPLIMSEAGEVAADEATNGPDAPATNNPREAR